MSASSPSADCVLVTGATGYIAQHVCQQLLDAGYRVMGTVRSLQSEKTRYVLGPDLFGPYGDAFTAVQADLSSSEGWAEAAQGCRFVCHVAAPVPKGAGYLSDFSMVETTVNGVENVLGACAGHVERVVMTSSIAAISMPNGLRSDPFDDAAPPLTEADWTNLETDPSKMSAYSVAKTSAERRAWRLVTELPEADRFELVCINPSIVVGPVLSPYVAASVEVLSLLAAGKLPALAGCPLPAPHVDVRDVAQAHVTALTKPEAAGKRYLLHDDHYDMHQLFAELGPELSEQGFRMPKSRIPLWFMRMLAWFSGDVKALMHTLGPATGRVRRADGSLATRELGIAYRPILDAYRDPLHSLIACGATKGPKGYLPPSQG